MAGYARLGLAVMGCLLVLSGCSNRDPYARNDVWYPTGVNATNLAAQVADPADLAGGRGDRRVSSAPQIKAVDRITNDTPKALPASSTTSTGGGGNSTPNNSPTGG
jgi:hypothetical protein